MAEPVRLPGDKTLRIDVALIHYPVNNRNGEVIGSAVTNLDLHDIARAGRTFGLDSYYIVTPFADQRQLTREIVDHWLTGYGAGRNPARREALSLIRICEDLAGLYTEVTSKWGERPTVLATSAQENERTVTFSAARARVTDGEPMLLLFGTGWGLTAEVLAGVDGLLPPIRGAGAYNHLSVRSAAAIVFDRLLGGR